MAYTKQELTDYIKQQEARLSNTASAWMKSEVKKSIEMAKQELAKIA